MVPIKHSNDLLLEKTEEDNISTENYDKKIHL